VSTPALLVEQRERHIRVSLNRPDARNAINAEMVAGLHQVCEDLERAPQIFVLAGGSGFFAAGADIHELRERGRQDALRGINSGLFDRIARLPMPSIAVIDGPAIGGGAELAYACDFRIGSPQARFGNPEPSLGIIAAAGACWRLAELVGEPLAKDVLLAGRVLGADEAFAAGLLSRLVGDGDDLEEAVGFLVGRMAASDPLALRLTKLTLQAPRAAHPTLDNVAQAICFETNEKETRMKAFLEKRS
jgi:enoyl-CoA hydratase